MIQNSSGKVEFCSDTLTLILRDHTRSGIKDSNAENSKEKNRILDGSTIYTSKHVLINLSLHLFQTVKNVVQLELSNNGLNNLPNHLNLLNKLEYLDISHNEFTSLPLVVSELTNLRVLKAQHNKLETVPHNFGNLGHLTVLDLSSNNLKDIPISCSGLKCLLTFSLAGNKFKKIPHCVSNGMNNLKTFDFSKNLKAELNIAPQSSHLKIFRARENCICPSFPVWIFNSKYYNLEVVVLDCTQFDNCVLPINTWFKSHISKLSIIQSNLLNKIVEDLTARLPNLEELNIQNTKLEHPANLFWSFPIESIANPLSVREINAASTGIPLIPKAISNFSYLINLDISHNRVTWLPDEICLLQNLEILLIDNNGIVMLPDNLGNMISLKELRANNNKISRIPESLKALSKLQFLDLYENEIQFPPENLSMLNLVGLDLERNYFSTTNSPIVNNLEYENMMSILRNHWNSDLNRENGQKEELLSEGSHYGIPYSDKDLDSNYSDNESEHVTPNDMDNERWDISEDSSDDFDPNERKEPKNHSYSPLAYYQSKRHMFCPGDRHERQIRFRVWEMLRNGSLVWPSNFEEGQFDDP